MTSSGAPEQSRESSSSCDSEDTYTAPFLINVRGFCLVDITADPKPSSMVLQLLQRGDQTRHVPLDLSPVCAILNIDDYDEAQSQLVDYLGRHLREPISSESNRRQIHDYEENDVDDITFNSLMVIWNIWGNGNKRTVVSRNNWHEVARTLQKRGLRDTIEVDILINRFVDRNVDEFL